MTPVDTAPYTIFLRAINVGSRRVAMADLRRLVQAMGYSSVQTYIASGNMILTTAAAPDRVAAHLEQGLREALGFETPAIIRTAAEMRAIAAARPFAHPPADAANITEYVALFKTEPSADAAAALAAAGSAVDELALHGRNLFWRYHRSRGESALTNNIIEKLAQTTATTRNINTIHTIIAKYLGG